MRRSGSAVGASVVVVLWLSAVLGGCAGADGGKDSGKAPDPETAIGDVPGDLAPTDLVMIPDTLAQDTRGDEGLVAVDTLEPDLPGSDAVDVADTAEIADAADVAETGLLDVVDAGTDDTSAAETVAETVIETTAPECGNGVQEGDEACDDGPANSDTAPDACRTTCVKATCGDGVVDSGETCDDGDRNSDSLADACRTTCALPTCGDGVTDDGEACDDGPANSNTAADACRTTCVKAFCGDQVVDTGEACDDGPASSNTAADACRTTCVKASCGDGVVDSGETCDNGADNSDTAADACRTICALATCGDGVIDDGEACDDGTGNSATLADACRPTCVRAYCGDGAVDTGELCDAGADNSDTAADACRKTCVPATCGDGVVDTGELCDNGANNSDTVADACRATCVPATCGDGVVDTGEACDDGTANSATLADACRTTCARASCGDGVVDSGERCDAGIENSDTAADACRLTCVPATCGDGVVDTGEVCDTGTDNSDTVADACRTTCVPAACGDGVIDSGEPCDDGADNADDVADACRATCVPARCGDGVLDTNETCDNGVDNSDTAADACRTTCAPASCGDGALDTGEQCDDGLGNDDTAADACRTTCVSATCGDGALDTDEQCDDGPGNDDLAPDACRTSCRKAACGDGVLDSDEQCDAGAENSDTAADACRTTCRKAHCGDGTIDLGESCDHGPANSDTAPDACRSNCALPTCGDGNLDLGEACDEGMANTDSVPDVCRTTCILPYCSDGIVDTGERCDSGRLNSDTTPDACRTTCQPAACGDGIVDAGEACDDGPANSDTLPGACRTTCRPASCGDGVVDAGEACDNGSANADAADACRKTCALPACGDGIVDTGERCDAGPANDDGAPDACRTTCQPAACGDGVTDTGEACDGGAANSATAPDACRPGCVLPACGDGVTDTGEACDDGPANSATLPDACRPGCILAHCGDGVVGISEVCDDGPANSATLPDACRLDCKPPSCGDGVVDKGESCDDGSANSDTAPGACRTTCALATCGDGIPDDGEACDRGQDNSATTPDGCRPTCVLAYCGDGVVDTGEACDEGAGNDDSTPDACRATCVLADCGDGVVDAGEACDDGAGNDDATPDACRTSCRLPFCGDGIVDLGEACDDANQDDFDACSSTCVAAACDDGVVNQGETDRDCGGPACPGCDELGACKGDGDCLGGHCVGGACKSYRDCDDILLSGASVGSGVYRIDVDGKGGIAPFDAYCDMVTDGGGWTLVLNYVHKADTAPALAPLADGLPLLGAGALGDDESGTSAWGHGTLAVLSALAPTEVLFYGATTGHERVVHFMTTLPGCVSYLSTGAGSCAGLAQSFEPLADHTAFLPGALNAVFGDRGEQAMLDHPFYKGGYYHWNIDTTGWGGANRYEVDDWANGPLFSTVQRVWFRRGPTCFDGILNQGEGAVDCGGACPTPCGNGANCQVDAQCLSGNCSIGNVCAEVSCGDGTVNQVWEQCDNGLANSDTAPNACRMDCMNPRCGDGVPDSGEACDDGDLDNTDACTTLCAGPHCGDGFLNQDESDVDCGGTVCQRCALGRACRSFTDCAAGSCLDGVCQFPRSCYDVLQRGLSTGDGVYTIDPDGPQGGLAPMPASCDMTTQGGGWTLVLNYVHKGGTAPDALLRTGSLPLLGAGGLGADESGTSAWGHGATAILSGLQSTSLMMYGATTGHARVLHFTSDFAPCVRYFATGLGSCYGLGTSFTPLADHDAITPGGLNMVFADKGENAMLDHPFYLAGMSHWNIDQSHDGGADRWEMDDWANGPQNSTIQRIWLRGGPTCGDGIRNRDEAAIDCGGTHCPACSLTVTATTPAAGALAYIDTPIVVSFSSPLNCGAVTDASVALKAGGVDVPARVACSGSALTVSAMLYPSTAHTVTVKGTVKEILGRALGADYAFTFTTRSTYADGNKPNSVDYNPMGKGKYKYLEYYGELLALNSATQGMDGYDDNEMQIMDFQDLNKFVPNVTNDRLLSVSAPTLATRDIVLSERGHFDDDVFEEAVVLAWNKTGGAPSITIVDTTASGQHLTFDLAHLLDACPESAVNRFDMDVKDMDDDGYDEIVIAGACGTDVFTVWVIDDGSHAYAIRDTFTHNITYPGLPYATNIDDIRISLGDYDGDQRTEIVAAISYVYVMSGKVNTTYNAFAFDDGEAGYASLWPDWGWTWLVAQNSPSNRPDLFDVAFLDIDGDKKDEIALGGVIVQGTSVYNVLRVADDYDDYARNLFAWRNVPSDPVPLASVAGMLTRPSMRNLMQVADVDGDIRTKELQFIDKIIGMPTGDYASQEFSVRPFLDATTFLLNVGPVTHGDVDGDGREELAFGISGGTGIAGQDTAGTWVLERQALVAPTVNASLLLLDVDRDGVVIEPMPRTMRFRNNKIISVVVAPPCADGITQNTDACESTIGTGTGDSFTYGLDVSVSASITAGVELEFSAGTGVANTTVAKIALMNSTTVEIDHEYTYNKSTSKTITYATGYDDDLVIYSTTPCERYPYEIINHYNPDAIGGIAYIEVPLKPSIYKVTRTYYNAHNGDEVDIDSSILGHTPKQLLTYPTREEALEILEKHASNGISDPETVGQGNGSMGVEMTIAEEHGYGLTVTVTNETTFDECALGICAGASVGLGVGNSFGFTWSSETSFSNSIGFIADETMFAEHVYTTGLFSYFDTIVDAKGRIIQNFMVVNSYVDP